MGYVRNYAVGVDFIASGEYRTLLNAFTEIRNVTFPVVVKTAGTLVAERASEEGDTAGDDAAAEEAMRDPAAVDEAATPAEAPAAAPAAGQTTDARGRKDADASLDNIDAFVEFFIAAGKKGVAVNRYKGLGEMNPDTLWLTTMDPDNRTLLQVRAEDHAEADQVFTTLMGDQVEPRRKFIEDNALDVTNLDV
ncbi:hypothetical protein JYU09_01400 [bacterium AH-315-O15]|nr:hypothetical protein [bacterium AH-315-O15]